MTAGFLFLAVQWRVTIQLRGGQSDKKQKATSNSNTNCLLLSVAGTKSNGFLKLEQQKATLATKSNFRATKNLISSNNFCCRRQKATKSSNKGNKQQKTVADNFWLTFPLFSQVSLLTHYDLRSWLLETFFKFNKFAKFHQPCPSITLILGHGTKNLPIRLFSGLREWKVVRKMVHFHKIPTYRHVLTRPVRSQYS